MLSVRKIWLDGSDGVLLLTVQLYGNLAQSEMLKVEWVSHSINVKCFSVRHTYYQTRWQLAGKRFLVINVSIMLRNRKQFAYHAAYGVFCSALFRDFAWAKKTDGITVRLSWEI